MPEFETLLYEESDGVAWVTLNRPEVLNAFNLQMQHELKSLWRGLRTNDDVRCIVLTGAGEKAFCVGIDRQETMGGWDEADDVGNRSATTGEISNSPWHFDDPGENIGPKSNELWKPVIAAVNGMACGGAFYILGEVDFVIAAEHATFFDPHVTFGMTACFESMHMLQKMPFGEIMRAALLGSSERISAQRGHQIGLVSEVVPLDGLHERGRLGRGRDRGVAPDRDPGDGPRAVDRPRAVADAGARHGQDPDPGRERSRLALRRSAALRERRAQEAAHQVSVTG